ncbi:hypothetical protein ACIQ9R_20555 [Streptomyces sp. NPDC094447]|uniref:hypothetical protein n=1 Tax=Streptomyces sp. NPDC094447 TaxID=3366062 RepID=UPI003828B52D
MHPRRTTILVLAALLTSGCVAVPHSPAPASPTRPAGLVPAGEHPPVPLTTWQAPAQADPREELGTADSHPAPASAKPAAPAAAAPAERPYAQPDTGMSDQRTQPRKRPGATRVKAKKNPKPAKAARRASPKPQAPKAKKRTATRRQQPAEGQPDMRQLCREARRINAPMGAADLCRSTYGR